MARGATVRVLAIQQAVLVVVFAVVAFQFQWDAAIRSFPSFVAAAAPSSIGRLALASFRAIARTSLEGAVFAVPAGDAETSAVLALSVLVAPGVTESFLTEFAGPSVIAHASARFASSMSAAVDAASRFRTIISRPAAIANAFVQFQTESALSAGAIGQALHDIAVDQCAIRALPAFPAQANSVNAESVVGAGRMGAIDYIN